MWSKLSFAMRDYIQHRGLDVSLNIQEVRAAWYGAAEELHPELRLHSRAEDVRNNVLRVVVDHPLWVGELEGSKKALVEKVVAKTNFPLQNILFIYRPR